MQYVLGLDIGIASVGWAVINLEKSRIEDLGVRMFNAAEQPKDGAPLAEPRRLARGMRRRLRRLAGRKKNIKELLIRQGLLPVINSESVFMTSEEKPDPWQLRYAGLDRRLTGEEFARALYHLAKRRGFKSNRKVAGDDEEGKVLAGIQQNRELMAAKGYRTAGEMLYRDDKFSEHKRNKADSYDNTVDRALLEEEVIILFQRQRELGNTHASEAFEQQFLALFLQQLPFASGDAVLAKVGKCTFEKDEYRAPRCAYTSERFILFGKVNALSVYHNGIKTPFSPEQRQVIIDLAHQHPRVEYSRIRKALHLEEDDRFTGLTYTKRVKGVISDTLECEKTAFYQLKGYHELRKAAEGSGQWETMKGNPALLDDLAFALTFYKTNDEIHDILRERGIADEIIAIALRTTGFAKVANLSLKAMWNIIPHLEQGAVYSVACTQAGYNHTGMPGGQKSVKLPLIDSDAIRNPVVLRALSQSRKVVNAVITRYGSPYRIHIELAREMGKNFEERKDIKKQQDENRKMRDEDLEHFREMFPNVPNPSGEDRLKWRLYREQGGQCAYSKHEFDLARLLESGYAEVDHILPYSRSFDDSMANKALVMSTENQRKKNRTPYEYLGHDESRWTSFEAWIAGNVKNAKKRRNLLEKNFDEEKEKEWKLRNLNDTQWIAREFSNFVKETLLFADPTVKVPVRCVKGQVTAMMRGLWGLNKDREENDLHHALDAAVVATLTQQQIQRITEYRKACEMYGDQPGTTYTDLETGEVFDIKPGRRMLIPPPWKAFRRELLARLSDAPDSELQQLALPSYADKHDIRPIFVSRMPQRKVRGAIHQETIRSTKWLEKDGVSVVRKPLTALKMADLANLVAPETNLKLYAAIRERMMAQLGPDGKEPVNIGMKAFGDQANPFRKPTNDGTLGPVVKSVKISKTQNTGIPIRGGIADNGDMARVDVFHRNGKFFLVPVYVADSMSGKLPDRAISAHKTENEWLKMDDSYQFIFSLYPYDLVKITTKKEAYLGYYKGIDRSTGAITLCHPNKGDADERTGVKLALSMEKYEVDMLGNYFLVKGETRRGLASNNHQQPCEVAD